MNKYAYLQKQITKLQKPYVKSEHPEDIWAELFIKLMKLVVRE